MDDDAMDVDGEYGELVEALILVNIKALISDAWFLAGYCSSSGNCVFCDEE
jgi:hypothetical protein